MNKTIIIRGGGDLATGTISCLHQCGYQVLVLEIAKPTAIRRSVAFSEAMYDGETEVEGIKARKITQFSEAEACWQDGIIPIICDEKAEAVKEAASSDKPLIVAVTACTTGIAHTYMAEEALIKKGEEMGVTVRVETNGASGVGKTAFFLYPNIEFACACGMSFLILDTKGDLARNCGKIAQKYYGYRVSVVDLRNPIRSDGNNLMTLVNRYMDVAREHPDNLAARANAEKYAKILAKTIVNPGGDEQDRGQNSYFYDAAEGVLATVIMTLSEFIPPDSAGHDKRHIMSVFKLVKELMAPMGKKNGFQVLIDSLPDTHKAGWMATAATSSSEQGMASVMSTVLSRLNAFLDSELEQVLCFDSAIDAEKFASEKSAIFLILPEEDTTKNFMAGLMIQNLSRELFAVADENGGKLQNRVVLYCDEFGTMPPFDVLPLFSAGRSRRLTLVPIIQSLAQLEKNYGKEGAEIICDNCQDTIFGGFSPQSKTADALSAALGSRTVLSGSVSQGKESSQSLQMMERALMTPDELKSIPKGEFVVMKTGTHPMRTKLRLFLDWGITFDPDGYRMPERAARKIAYIDQGELIRSIHRSCIKNPYNREGSR